MLQPRAQFRGRPNCVENRKSIDEQCSRTSCIGRISTTQFRWEHSIQPRIKTAAATDRGAIKRPVD